MVIRGKNVEGVNVDCSTRCAHYATERDVIAIKFPCCNTYYSCYECHEAVAGHERQVWLKSQFDEKAILCGNCGWELTIREYLNCESTCPNCKCEFNPNCQLHYGLYFDLPTR